ncbi:MAG TPA: UDP-N-acetylmuramoyl-L-alanyl-D-glutamate--2,6-diaminopimelate ligase [Gammaproteobacteria bacterium]|jgi:UDP-N-acetylmuramoyl-L-alanyl-D-glutamate--2,6-diaminopimelate ligase
MMAALATAVMSLGELLGPAAGELAGLAVSDLVSDSRQVTAGAAFVALPGARGHGLEHAEEALARGAAVVLYAPAPGRAAPSPGVAVADLPERLGELARTFFGLAQRPMALTGVTGTNGKTTVAQLIAAARTQLGRACGYLGTLGVGVPPALAPQALTTPDCLTLHRSLKGLGTAEAALEVSSHALSQDRIAGLRFSTAVFTNLTRDHLDYYADLQSYAEAKAKLFTRDGLEHAVIFIDDAYGAALTRRLAPSVEALTVSLVGDASIRGRIVAATLEGLSIETVTPRGSAQIHSPLIGDFNAENLLLALGALLAMDTPLGEACAALAACPPSPGRMQRVAGPAGTPSAVVDYAHTPDALRRALESLRGLTQGELWCVFGCGGERDKGKRPMMGAVAAEHADHVVLTDDNPRGEDPAAIVADIRRGMAEATATVEHDRRAAIAFAIRSAAANDVVLVAGKGHETVQHIGRERREFSDRAVLESLLGGVT